MTKKKKNLKVKVFSPQKQIYNIPSKKATTKTTAPTTKVAWTKGAQIILTLLIQRNLESLIQQQLYQPPPQQPPQPPLQLRFI